MKRQLLIVSRLHRAAVRAHLEAGPSAGLESAHELGGRRVAAGLPEPALAKLRIIESSLRLTSV